MLMCLILFYSTCMNTSLGVNCDLPQWKVGNWWKFNVEILGELFNLVGKSTYTIISDNADIILNGQDFNCYQIDVIGSGTIQGSEMEGNWTLTSQHYYLKSDQSWVSTQSSYEDTVTIYDSSIVTPIYLDSESVITTKIVIETTYTPPFEAKKGFPLTVGKRWSATTTETSKTQIILDGDMDSKTESEAYTKTFLVLQKDSIMLPTGEVAAYVIKRTDHDGAYTEGYYSPEVGFDVRIVEYDSNGTMQTKMELINYKYQSNGDDLSIFDKGIFSFLLVSIIVISVSVAIYFLKKNKKSNTLK